MGVVSGFTGDINGTVTSSVSMVLQNKKCLYYNMSGKFILSSSLKQIVEEVYY